MSKPVTKKQNVQSDKSVTPKPIPHSKKNGYRENSNYALCFDCLAYYATRRPYPRKDLIEKYAKLSGKNIKNAGYDMSVILSPAMHDGSFKFHKSAERATRLFPHFVIKCNGRVQLVFPS